MNIFENIEHKGYVGKTGKFADKKDILSGQKSAEIEIKLDALRKEYKEDSIGKIDLLEIMVSRIAGCLTQKENAEIIDDIIEQGASKKLAEDLIDYWELLGNKKILPGVSSAKEILEQVDYSLRRFVERARNGKLTPTAKEVIFSDFNFIKQYLNLLKNNRLFEKAELETKEGFLVKKIGEKNANSLRGNREEYIKTCKEILEPPINNNL